MKNRFPFHRKLIADINCTLEEQSDYYANMRIMPDDETIEVSISCLLANSLREIKRLQKEIRRLEKANHDTARRSKALAKKKAGKMEVADMPKRHFNFPDK